MGSPILAVDLGGTKTVAALVRLGDGSPVVEHELTVPTPASSGGRAVLSAALSLANAVVARARAEGAAVGPCCVGISSAGTVSPRDGVVTHATDVLPGWAGTRLAEAFRRSLALPAYALNDVHAHGLGEAVHGAATGHRSVLAVAVGTGVGGAVVVDGQVWVGERGVAGHVGHVPVPEASGMPCTCGRTGHLEGLASGSGIRAAFRARTGLDVPATQVSCLASGAGQVGDDARTLLADAGRATGRVIGGLLNVLDPDVAVVGGGMTAAAAPWRQSLHEGVAQEAMDVVAATPVIISDAGAHAALWGAAHWASARHTTGHHRTPTP